MMPMPPSRAIVIAVRASVTESIAAERSGTLSSMLRERRDRTSTSRGRTSLYCGRSRTSSKVRASRKSVRAMCVYSAGNPTIPSPTTGERRGTASRSATVIVEAHDLSESRCTRGRCRAALALSVREPTRTDGGHNAGKRRRRPLQTGWRLRSRLRRQHVHPMHVVSRRPDDPHDARAKAADDEPTRLRERPHASRPTLDVLAVREPNRSCGSRHGCLRCRSLHRQALTIRQLAQQIVAGESSEAVPVATLVGSQSGTGVAPASYKRLL